MSLLRNGTSTPGCMTVILLHLIHHIKFLCLISKQVLLEFDTEGVLIPLFLRQCLSPVTAFYETHVQRHFDSLSTTSGLSCAFIVCLLITTFFFFVSGKQSSVKRLIWRPVQGVRSLSRWVDLRAALKPRGRLSAVKRHYIYCCQHVFNR